MCISCAVWYPAGLRVLLLCCLVSCWPECPCPMSCGALLSSMSWSCAVCCPAGLKVLVLCCVMHCWPSCSGPVPCGALLQCMSLVMCHAVPFWPVCLCFVLCRVLLSCVSWSYSVFSHVSVHIPGSVPYDPLLAWLNCSGAVWCPAGLHVLVLCLVVPC